MNKIFVTKSFMPSYEEYIEMIKPLWDSHWLTNMGEYHNRLEAKLEEYLQVPNLSLIVNGHMALELALQAMNLNAGAEIITTPFTFVSTTHAIVRNGFKPVFCDVKDIDGTIDENKIEQLITEKTEAILPVHVYGNICNVEKIQNIADKYGLKVIYDAAHAFGELYEGQGVGIYGDASIFSFHATKVFHTIEGGAVSFREKELYGRLYNLKNFGIRGEEAVVEVGANAKMNEFSAAMGLCNLKYIDNVITSRKERCLLYESRLSNIKGIKLLKPDNRIKRNYAYMPIIIEDVYGYSRDEVYDFLKGKGIYTRKYFYPLTCDQICYDRTNKQYDVPVARDLSCRVLVLPLYDSLSLKDVDRIVELIENPLI